MSRSRLSLSSRDDLRLSPGLILLTLLSILPASAQERISSALVRPAVADTPTVVLEGRSIDISPPQEKSTTLAMLLSAALPGAGQVYTERWISIPVIWGFGVYFGSQMAKLDDKYDEYRSKYDASVVADTLNRVGDLQLKNIRDFYRDQRDEFAVYLGLTYILNIVDAYVGAALYGFDVSPDIHNGVRVQYTIPLAVPPPSTPRSGRSLP